MTRLQSSFPSSDILRFLFQSSAPDVSRHPGFRPAYLIQALKQSGTGLRLQGRTVHYYVAKFGSALLHGVAVEEFVLV